MCRCWRIATHHESVFSGHIALPRRHSGAAARAGLCAPLQRPPSPPTMECGLHWRWLVHLASGSCLVRLNLQLFWSVTVYTGCWHLVCLCTRLMASRVTLNLSKGVSLAVLVVWRNCFLALQGREDSAGEKLERVRCFLRRSGCSQDRLLACANLCFESRPLVSTLVGLILSNAGVVPCEHRAYVLVNRFLLPLSIPLLLFSAARPSLLVWWSTLQFLSNLQGHASRLADGCLHMVVPAGPEAAGQTARADVTCLSSRFCCNGGRCACCKGVLCQAASRCTRRAHAACTCAGTLIAYKVVPLAALGADGWKVG